MTFVKWLKQQKDRNDVIGDLSRDTIRAIEKSTFRGRNFNSLEKLMNELNSAPQAFDALYKAKVVYEAEVA